MCTYIITSRVRFSHTEFCLISVLRTNDQFESFPQYSVSKGLSEDRDAILVESRNHLPFKVICPNTQIVFCTNDTVKYINKL